MPSGLRQRMQLFSARRAGKKDGKKGVPLHDDTESYPFRLLSIKQQAEEQMHVLDARHQEQDRDPKSRYLQAKQSLDEARSEYQAKLEEFGRREKERDAEEKKDKAERERLEKERTKRLTQGIAGTSSQESSSLDRPTPMPVPEATSSEQAPTVGALALEPRPRAEAPQPSPVAAVSSEPERQPKRFGLRAFSYWLLISLIVFGELPLNAMAFRLFGENDSITYVMTFAIALVLVLIAHYVGMKWAESDARITEQVFTGALVLFCLSAIVMIGIVRTKYVMAESEGDIVVRYLGPFLSTVAFIFINIVIYAGAIALSKLRHDPDAAVNISAARKRAFKEQKKELERQSKLQEESDKDSSKRAAKRNEMRRKQSEKEAKERAKLEEWEAARVSKLNAKARKDYEAQKRLEEQPFINRQRQRTEDSRREADALANLEGRIESLQREVNSLKSERDALAGSTEAEAKRIRKYYERIMSEYCAANVNARKDRKTPPVLKSLPVIEIPEELREVLVSWE